MMEMHLSVLLPGRMGSPPPPPPPPSPQAIKKKNYVLIFMDLHMSRMSGLEATLQIRDWEQSQGMTPCHIVGSTPIKN